MIPSLRSHLPKIKTTLWPQSAFSWPTVIYMSLISWLMSVVSRILGASAFTVGLMATLAWIFLALGVGWAFEARRIKPFGLSIGPWVTGGILCLLLFGSWGGAWGQPALITWPLISFLVVAIPNLVTWELRPKRPAPAVRQSLALMLGVSLLFSSWFQFYFRIQAWLRDYPSLMTDHLDRSTFVYPIPGQTLPLSAGISHLTQAEQWVTDQIDGKPWPWVERWLLNLAGQEEALQADVALTQAGSPEENLWQINLQAASLGTGYSLRMLARWLGPSATGDGYYFEKACDVLPVAQRPDTAGPTATLESVEPTNPAEPVQPVVTTQWTQVRCQLETPLRDGQP